MGFCLFESAEGHRLHVAVNPAFVEDVISKGNTGAGYPLSEIAMTAGVFDRTLLVVGKDREVWDILKKGTKIAIQPADIRIFSGKRNLTNRSLRMNNLNRVAVVIEVFPETLEGVTLDTTTASYMYLEDGKSQLIVERPGLFVFRANHKGDIPALSYK